MQHQENQSKGRKHVNDWRAVGHLVVDTLTAKVFFLRTLPFLVFGAAFVGVGIDHGTNLWQQHRLAESISAPVEATIQRAWWHLEIDRKALEDGATNWPLFTKPSYCVKLRTTAAATGVACMRYGPGLDYVQAAWQLRNRSHGATPSVPWRDSQGNLAVEFVIPEESWTWLNETASRSSSSQWAPLKAVDEEGRWSVWDEFMINLSDPESDVIGLWSQPIKISAMTDPNDPSRILPAAFLDDQDTNLLSIFLFIVGLLGAFLWVAGVFYLLADQGKRTKILAAALTLALAPFWGQWVWRGLDFMFDHSSNVGYVFSSILPRMAVAEIMPIDYFAEPDEHVVRYSFRESLYGPLFEGIRFDHPSTALDEEEAVNRAQAQITQMLESFTPTQRSERFALLACYSKSYFQEAENLFVPAAQKWMHRPEERAMANTFLDLERQSWSRGSITCEKLASD